MDEEGREELRTAMANEPVQERINERGSFSTCATQCL